MKGTKKERVNERQNDWMKKKEKMSEWKKERMSEWSKRVYVVMKWLWRCIWQLWTVKFLKQIVVELRTTQEIIYKTFHLPIRSSSAPAAQTFVKHHAQGDNDM